MSVSNDSQVAYRRFSGYTDPRYPEGQWLGSVTVSEDATGGEVIASLIFSEATAFINSRFFTLEEVGFSVQGTNAGGSVAIATDNLGRDGPAAFQHRFVMALVGGTSSLFISPQSRDLPALPMVLGAMRVPLVQTRIFARKANLLAGDDDRFEAAGYWWGSRSILVDGGPQRPPTGLYKA